MRRINKRVVGALLASLIALAVGAQQRAPAKPGPATAPSPNIIVILADDLGYADVSTYFPGRFHTPNIDRLGREGVVFTQGYVAAPVCAPSRAGLITGRQPQRFGFEYLPDGVARATTEHLGLATGERTIADLLRAGGYHTGAIGKWHLGMDDEFYPMRRGFDEYWGFLPGQTNYIRTDAPDAVNGETPGTDAEIKGQLERPRLTVGADNAVVTGANRARVDVGNGYLTDQLTDHAVDYIQRNKDKPFFLYLAYNAPHTPLQTTRKYYDRFPQITDKKLRVYASMISALDDGVGRILDTLDASGLGRNTIVVFLSDNGCAGYNPGLCSPKPLAGSKLTQFEGGVRVPFMMRYPARIRPGTREDRPVSSLDLLPTFVAAAKLRMPADRVYDGVNLLPDGGTSVAAPATRSLYWRTLPLRALREGRWKYHRDYDGNEYLFDIAADPGEQINLATRQPARTAAMRAAYAKWEADKAKPSWRGKFVEFDFGGRHFKFVA